MSKTAKQESQKLSLIAVGDIYVRRENEASIMARVKPYVKQADFALANQEAAISDRGTSRTARLGMRSRPSAIAALSSAGFHAVGLANNHTLDYGPEAALQTIEILDAAGIPHAGFGKNIAEAHRPAIVERKDTRLALLSYSSVFQPTYAAGNGAPGIAVVKVRTAYEPHPRTVDMPGVPPIVLTFPDKADIEAMVQDVKAARKQADIVVISWHWGVSQGHRMYTDYQVELGHAAIDAGADLIFGHHSHSPLGIEWYKGKAIFYDLSNFAFELGKPNTVTKESLMLRCHISGKKIQRVSFLPVRLHTNFDPEVVDTKIGSNIVAMVQRLSERFGTRFEVGPEEVTVVP
ncbi:MAG: CapA family protein [Chloroflexi bacterium]|nr:CapA family protein [Chloroflexota bacterium]